MVILFRHQERQRQYLSAIDRHQKVREIIIRICADEEINPKELQSGSRRRHISLVRAQIARKLVNVHGVPMTMVAWETGVSTSAISKIIRSS